MQETSIVPMKIPEHAKLLETTDERQNFSSSYDTKTSTWVRWITGLQTSALTSGVLINVPVDAFNLVGSIGVVCTSIAGAVGAIGMAIEHKSIRAIHQGVKDIKGIPDYSEWEKKSLKRTTYDHWDSEPVSTKGYKVRKSTAKSFTMKFFDPRRMLGGAILSETLWYNPVSDIYTLETQNLRMFNWWITTEQYAGRRKAMSDALNSL